MKNRFEIRGDFTAIFLKRRNGQVIETLIDTNDLEKVNSFPGSWCAKQRRNSNSFYVINHKSEYMHRLIMDAPKDKVVDHINRNSLDNRRRNLRVVTNSENRLNHSNNLFSQLQTGSISWHKRDKKWRVRVYENKKRKWLGHFSTHKEAEECLAQYIEEQK
ncbi:HNH endonuclease [Sutcliffiella sp. FSL R7-0096]|uniref:HNH endonuclease n=1 Tax=Sutcliffiella sp. FSL R7-0096 TaxID=2921670 RepID=UPI003159CFAA